MHRFNKNETSVKNNVIFERAVNCYYIQSRLSLNTITENKTAQETDYLQFINTTTVINTLLALLIYSNLEMKFQRLARNALLILVLKEAFAFSKITVA